MESNKKNIVNGAMEFAKYMTEQVPQKDANGNVTYYFSGSLAMLLISSAKAIIPAVLDKDGKVISQQETMSVQEEHKRNLSQGIRPLTGDLDLICVDIGAFKDKGDVFLREKIHQNCSHTLSLCPSWESGVFTKINTDILSNDRSFSAYDIAELTLEDGSKVIISDPLVLMCHKIADGVSCLSSIENRRIKGVLTPEKEQKTIQKYQKNIKDLVAMFNGLISLYPNIDFAEIILKVLQNCDLTAFSKMMDCDSRDKIKKLYEDSKELINDENMDLFHNLFNTISVQNKAIIENQNSRAPEQ